MKSLVSLLVALLHFPLGVLAQTPMVLPTVERSKDAGDEPARLSALRAKVIDLANALADGDSNIRDGFWFERATVAPSKLLAVNLIAGNHYWFCIATGGNVTPKLRIYDETGKPIEAEARAESGLAVAGVTSTLTGRYFIEVGSSGEQLPEFCLLYLFQ